MRVINFLMYLMSRLVVRNYFFIKISILFFVFTSCKSSINTISVPKGSNEIINLPPKKIPLSNDEMLVWGHADLKKDTIPGMSIAKAYQFLEGKKGVNVIVAIADSGVDIEHEDLKDVLWINTKEIPNNGKDDDGNGYVDDVYGWNFLGNSSGKIVNADQLEITRIVKKGIEKFGNKKASEIAQKDKKEFEQFLKLKEEYQKSIEKNKDEIANVEETLERLNQIKEHFNAVRKFLGKKEFTAKDLKGLRPKSIKFAMQIADVASLLERDVVESELDEFRKNANEVKKNLYKIKKGYDLDFNSRQSMGDDLYDINDKYYGNNNVIGSKDLEMHGTHVAGITAATRNNNLGVNGVANNVKIMTVRVVPDGDEHDKDVALGIRYAVDNGAKIINTSFGKRFSPNKEWVFDAIKYAAEKDVLIVNAAGNDSKNLDKRYTYPSDSKDLLSEFVDNVITIGATSPYYSKKLVANFSNFGKINVDVFAPGDEIYSTVPKNEYEAVSGTSMAAPAVSGVAALIRSYYPQLSASQVKRILMNSGTKIDMNVVKPGAPMDTVPFSELSVSGRIVNAYNALKMADRMVNGKTK